MKATLRLFKAVPVKDKTAKREAIPEIMLETMSHGFVFAPEVFGNYTWPELQKLAKTAAKEIGLSGKQMNSSFHKSWGKVATAPMVQLMMEQLIHYVTTYGFETLGIYNSESVYIPAEKLEIPDLVEGFEFMVVKGLTEDELKTKLADLLGSGIALKESTIKDVLDVAHFLDVDQNFVDAVKNREVKVALYDFLGMVPGQPVEFLRYVLFKTTNRTLLIKDRATLALLKLHSGDNITGLFNQYEKKYGLEPLASVFYRFKPLFLALRTNAFLKNKINKVRKLANKCHVPMNEDYFNTITAQAKKGTLDFEVFESKLADLSIFRKVRLANTLSYRSNEEAETILYKIRNGKGYATKMDKQNVKSIKKALGVVINSIGNDLSFLKGKRIYIPKDVVYSIPATEKQFTGMFPSGTYVKVDRDLIVGVYWENVDRHRIDLDLSMIAMDVKIGWDSQWRTSGQEILFSGDMTDATDGASELFYVRGVNERAFTLMLNYFNASGGWDHEAGPLEVPFKIVIGSEKVEEGFGRKSKQPYMLDPNNVVLLADSVITAENKQKFLGLVTTKENDCRFYFSEFDAGKSITAGGRGYNEDARRYFIDYHRSLIKLEDVLKAAGVEFVEKDVEEIDIDLSPAKLEKDTFIKLLTGKE